MKRETIENLRMVALALLAMVVLPLGYRVWSHFHPQPESKSLTVLLQEVNETRREALLAMPLGEWSEADMKLAPDIHEWLTARKSVILPWEWSEEARKKDAEGFRGLWARILGDQLAEIDGLEADRVRQLEDLRRKAETERILYDHATNQYATAALAATNAFPCEIEIEELSPGRFWGWNRSRRTRALVERSALDPVLAELDGRMRKHAAKRRELADRTAKLEAEVGELKRTGIEVKAAGAAEDESRRIAATVESIRTVFRYRDNSARGWLDRGPLHALRSLW